MTFFHRPVGLVELLILYAHVLYTPRASDYRLISKSDCKKEDSVSCWFKTHQPRQGQRPIGRWFFFGFFFTDLKTSLSNFIPVHLTVISPHHRRLCFYFWTFVCSNCDIFHLLGTDKGRCKTTLAQNTHNHLNRLLYLYKCK